MTPPPPSLPFWARTANTLGPFHGYSAPRTAPRLAKDFLRDLGILFSSSLPLVLVFFVAALEVFDVFKLRRLVATLFVYGLEWPWEIGVMLSGPLALFAWTVVVAVLLVPAIALLHRTTDHSRSTGRDLMRRYVGFTATVIGTGMFLSLAVMFSFTLVMVLFALVWTLPLGLFVLVAIYRVRSGRSFAALAVPAGGAIGLHVLWIAIVLGALGSAGLVSRAVIEVPTLAQQELGGMKFSADGKEILLRYRFGDATSVVDIASGTVSEDRARTFPSSDEPFKGNARFVLTDGMEIAHEGGAIEFRWGNERRLVQGHRPMETKAIALSPDGALLASCGTDNVVRLWRPGDGTLHKTLWGHSDDVLGVAFSPDGKTLASASKDGTLRLWDRFR
ncbi:MAG: hypothetical protein GYA21_06790 [Myxococcales bacterium]|nr:hypothetical protein [Myxococcales bacterium]